MKRIVREVKHFYQEFQKFQISDRAAALSYYTLFSFVPLIILLLLLGSFFLAPGQLESWVTTFFERRFGTISEEFLSNFFSNLKDTSVTATVTTVGLLIVLKGAYNLFNHVSLQTEMKHRG